jgi:hypothetical protein
MLVAIFVLLRGSTTTVLIAGDPGVVFVDFDQRPRPVGGLHHPSTFGPRLHRVISAACGVRRRHPRSPPNPLLPPKNFGLGLASLTDRLRPNIWY